MKIAVQALNLRVGKDSRSAGVARAVVQMTVALAAHPEVREVRAFLDREANVPREWVGVPGLDVRVVRKYRLHHAFAGKLARLQGFRYAVLPIIGEPLLGGLPMWTVIYDLFPITHPEWYEPEAAERMARMLRETIPNAQGLICDSEAAERDLIRHFPETKGKTKALLLGPGHDPGDPTRDLSHLDLGAGPFTLTVATIEPRKNLPRLLEALAILRQTDPRARLVVAGGKGWETGETFETLRRLGLEDAVRFLGFVADEDLAPLYSRCELFVFPSLDEGFGLPPLEAMSYGAPVLLARAGSLPEVGGEVARYCDPLSVDSIADAWRAARADAGWLAASRTAGPERAATFRWDRFADGMVRFLRGGG